VTEQFKDWQAMAQRAWDELCIMKTVSKVAHAQDNLDREAYKSCFTDRVLLTESVMFPDWEPKEISIDELTDMYFSGLEKFDAGHHMVFNHIINVIGDDATCVADLYGVAVFIEGDESKTSFLGGRYSLRLRREAGEWRIYQRAVTVRYRGEGDALFRAKVAARAEERRTHAPKPQA
jgi:SnoaL-like domain